MNDFNPKRQVAIIWSIEDVQELDSSLTDEQAFEILKAFERNHDSSMESMWGDLQYHVDEFKRKEKK